MAVYVNAGSLTGVSVVNEYLNATDPRVGLAPNATADQGVKLQAAIDMTATSSQGGALFLPAGEYRKAQKLQLPANRSITILGAGKDATTIRDTVDLGDGEWSIENTNTRDCKIQDLGFQGPGGAIVLGEFPADMGGIWVTNRLKLVDVKATGYAWGLGLIEDHEEFHRCDLRGNGYGLYWLPLTDGLGDQYFNRLDLRDQAIANMAISSSGSAGNAIFLQCLLGNSPFGILRPGTPGGTSTRAIADDVTFLNCPVSAVGHGFIFDEIGDGGVGSTNIIGGSTNGYDDALMIDGYDRTAWIDVKTINTLYVWGALPYVADAVAANQVPCIKVKTVQNVTVRDPGTLLEDIAAGNAKFADIPAGGQFAGGADGVEVGQVAHGGQRMCVYGSAGTISRGELVQLEDDYFTVKKHTGSVASRVIGVALHDAVSGEALHVWIGGQGTGLEVKSTGTITQWGPLKADTSTAGSATDAASVADANCIGRAIAAASGGYVAAELFL